MKEEERPLGSSSNCPYSWLNEWLCEYVDGTMDPSLRRVFDKYVQANPDLKAHVERLRHTRELLCACSREAKQEAPEAVRARVQETVECDLLRTPHSLEEAVRERPMTAMASALVVALVVGMFTGAALFTAEMPSAPGAAQQAQAPPQAPPPASSSTTQPRLQHTWTTAAPREASAPAFQTLIEANAGMSYAADSASGPLSWQPAGRP